MFVCFKGKWATILLPFSNYSCYFGFCRWKYLCQLTFLRIVAGDLQHVSLMLVVWVFLEEKGEDCVCMSTRKGFAKTLHSLAWVREGGRAREWEGVLVLRLPSPIKTADVIGSEVKACCVCLYCIVLYMGVSWHTCKLKCSACCYWISSRLLSYCLTRQAWSWHLQQVLSMENRNRVHMNAKSTSHSVF